MALYEVTTKAGDNQSAGQVRLIEAKTRAGARSFAAKDSIDVIRATAVRAHMLAARGVKMETALEEDDGK